MGRMYICSEGEVKEGNPPSFSSSGTDIAGVRPVINNPFSLYDNKHEVFANAGPMFIKPGRRGLASSSHFEKISYLQGNTRP